jgi:hypothetical protein
MNTLLIGYDLNQAGQDYQDLIQEIKAMGKWWHYLDSTWIVKTSETHTSARDRLKPFLDDNDELLVVNITGDAAAWQGFVSNAGTWLRENIK